MMLWSTMYCTHYAVVAAIKRWSVLSERVRRVRIF